ncbi:hypothetical protein KP509_13G036100 [Ceratopteris richardii]|uniref:WW domain-containing protein n=1 Tax=Ceratopteris richardii TaxID=49495 RepID=A0A8T2TGW3_CERRI|nr:hypothetical protein KP509_13G036100 [Ceratopteris richardii]KAH7421007.1 hypothetical protein KP509_13G036100 [Ceratopteris richardii]
MNVDLSNKMATQSWQPQSVQAPSSGQPSMAGPQGQRQSSTSANQSQGMASSNYNASPSVPSSPSNIVSQFRSNTDSLNPSQSSSVPTGTSLPQAASPVSVSGYSSQPPLYTGARWPPPSPGHSPLPVPPSSGPQSISSVHNSQSSTLQQHAAIGTVQGPTGQSVPPVPSWQTQHAPSPVAPVRSGPPPSCSSSASQESSAVNCHPVSSFSPSLTAATTQTVSSGLAVPSVSLGSPLPAISAPPGLAPLSVSQVPVKVAAQPSTTGTPAQPGGGSVVNVLSSMTNSSVVTGPSGPPAVQETSGSSAATPVKMTPATTSNPANLLVPPAVGSAPPGPPGISLTAHPASLTGAHQLPVDTARPGLLASAIPTSAALPGAGSISTPPMPQQQQYVPYINVLPVPQLLPWAQGQPRPFPPFVNVPNPYLPPIRPVVPVVANSSMTKTSSDSTTPLAPPGEQEKTVKASATEGDKVLSVSSLSGQVVNGQPTPNTSNTISISSNVTESALGSELSSKVMEVADVWTAHRTLEGNVYYYNSVTGESTYEKPAGFHGEVDKVAAQPTPVSWESVGETGWVLVTTNDAKKYYFHKDTKATSWQVPAEVVEYRKKQIEEASLKISVGGEHVKPNSDKSTVSFSLTAPNVGNTTQKPAASAASSSALDLIKKKLQDSGLIASENIGSTDGNAGKTLISEGGKEKAKDNHAEKSSSESSSDSDDDEQGPTKEERILQFKEMLKEKGIAPFSKWEKELPKIIFDPRFKVLLV